MTAAGDGGRAAALAALGGPVVPRPGPIAAQVHAALLRAIIRGELPPDTPLSEQALCARLGVSRQPVREALLRLAGLGLIQIFAQRGSVVTRLSEARVRAAQLVREGVEVEVIRRATAQGPPAGAEALAKEVALQRTFLAHGDQAGFYDSDERFHRTLGAMGGLDPNSAFLEAAKAQLDRIRYLSLRARSQMERLLDDHARIAAAVAAGDGAEAALAMRGHLRRVLDDLARLRAEAPALFEAG